jgi:hypothetical protein
MSVIIDEMETELNVASSDLPLSDAQVEMIVQRVLQRLEERQRDQQRQREATVLRSGSTPDAPGEGGRGWD